MCAAESNAGQPTAFNSEAEDSVFLHDGKEAVASIRSALHCTRQAVATALPAPP